MLNCKQGQGQSVSEYKELIKGWADAIIFHGGTVAEKISDMTRTAKDGTIIFDPTLERIARERTLAMLMIRGADPTIYGTLIAELFLERPKRIPNGHDGCGKHAHHVRAPSKPTATADNASSDAHACCKSRRS